MLRRSAIRHGSTQRDIFSWLRGSALCGRAVFYRTAVLILIASGLLPTSSGVLPLARAQHGGHGGYHPSAPRMSAPHMSAPARSMQSQQHGYAPHAAPYQAQRSPSNPEMNRPAAQPQRPMYATGNAYSNPSQGPRNQYAVPPARGGQQQHLGAWMQNHQGQSLANQEDSLRREPGFNRLPQQQQQRLINRLHQLDAMPPDQRQRMIGRNENFERLSPERRQAFLGSAQELRGMDPARSQQVRGAFRVLRDMPPQQRERVLNSPAYRSMYSDHERQMLGNLLSVEPYQPH